MKTPEKPFAIATWLLVLVLAFMALLVPLYSDEVAMQMARSRFFAEGGHLLNLLPQCRDLALAIPVSWYPGAAVNAVLYAGAGELGLRLRGIALCLAWLTLLWVWAGRLSQHLLPRRMFQASVLSLNLLGVVPLVLALARSEQLMVLGLAAYCLMPLYAAVTRDDRVAVQWLKAASFLLLNSVFLLAHPKALFFSPLIFLSCALVFRKGGWPWMIMLPLSGFMVWQTFGHAQTIGQCSNAPLISQVLAQQTLDFRLLFSEPFGFIKAALGNIAAAPGAVLARVPLTASSQSNWLPAVDARALASVLPAFGAVLKVSLMVGMISMAVLVPLSAAVQAKRRMLTQESLLGVALVISLLVHASIYSTAIWHFYTPGLIVPAFVLLFMLAARGAAVQAPWAKLAALSAAWYAYGMALASVALLTILVAPPLVRNARNGTFAIPGQSLSVPVFLGGDRRSELQALSAQCGIRDGDSRLVVDGSGYFAFQHGRQPINVLYVSSVAFGADIGNGLPAFLRKMDSSGVISRCDYLPRGLADRATVSGSMCCLSRSQLQQD